MQRPGEQRVARHSAQGASAERAVESLRPPRQKKPAPIVISLLVWVGLSALLWAGIAMVFHFV